MIFFGDLACQSPRTHCRLVLGGSYLEESLARVRLLACTSPVPFLVWGSIGSSYFGEMPGGSGVFCLLGHMLQLLVVTL